MSIWAKIVGWINEYSERKQIIREFNVHANKAWDNGELPVMLKAKISWGNRANKHPASKLKSGFKVIIYSSEDLDSAICSMIGMAICSDQRTVRKLMRCGFDTLEVFNSNFGDDGFEIPINQLLIS